MKYLIFVYAVRVARWACVLGDSDDWLEKAEELEKRYYYWGC